MSEPTRYSPMHGDEYEFTMRADANGDYVEFDDYESLRQQLAGWVDQHHRDSAELRRLCAARDEQRDGRLAQAERAAAAESRIAELEQQLAEARAGRVPPDWRIVPIDPTEEMLEAAEEAMRDQDVISDDAVGELDTAYIYNAYLEAAPQPPAGGAGLDKPLSVFSEGEWIYKGTGQSFSAAELDEAAFVVYRAAQPQQEVGHE